MRKTVIRCLTLPLSLLVALNVVWQPRLNGASMTEDSTKTKASIYTDDFYSELPQDETAITVAGAQPDGVNSDIVAADTGSADSRPADTGSANSGSANSGSANSGSANSGSANSGSADTGSADTGSADTGSADTGSADSGSADSGLADVGSADSGPADTRPADTAVADADVESSAVWESSFAGVELTGVWANDVLAIADTQIGYTESAKNYEIDPDGNRKGYTRYGAWYGNPYSDWSAMFVSFCLSYAKVDRTLMPIEASCPLWVDKLETAKLYRDTNYTPKAGDVIFFDDNDDGSADHVGLVYEINEETGEIKTIEGDSGDAVQYVTYNLTDENILGYGELPERPKDIQRTQQTLTAVIYQDDKLADPLNNETKITVSGLLPADAAIIAYPVKNVEIEDQVVLAAYDISILLPDGTVFEPASDAPVTVNILLPKTENEAIVEDDTEIEKEGMGDVTLLNDNSYNVYYVPDGDDAPEVLEAAAENRAVSFQAQHFSVYAVTVPATGNLPVTIGWSDGASAHTTGSVMVTLKRSYGTVIDETVSSATLSASNSWAYTFSGLPTTIGGETVTYSVDVPDVSGYVADVVSDGTGCIITFTQSALGITTGLVSPGSFGEASDCTIDYTMGHLPIIFDSCTCNYPYVVRNITLATIGSIYPYTSYGIWGSGAYACTTGKVIYLQNAPAGTKASIKVTYPIVGEYNGVKIGAHVTYQITSARASPQAALLLSDSLFNGAYEYGISRNEVTIEFFYYNEGMTTAQLSAAPAVNVANSYYTLHSLSYGRTNSNYSEEVDFNPSGTYPITKLESAVGGDIAYEVSRILPGQVTAYATSAQTGADDTLDSPTFWKHSVTCYQSGAFNFTTHHGLGTYTDFLTTCYWWAPSSGALNHSVPPPPTKMVSDSDETDVTYNASAIGETLTYKVNQQVGVAGVADTGKYNSLVITDTLPAGVGYVSGSARLYVYADGLDETKTPALPLGTGTNITLSSTTATAGVSGDASTGQTVTLTFASSYLSSMVLRGQVYQLRFNVTVLDNETIRALKAGDTLDNSAYATFNTSYSYSANETKTRIPGETSVSVQKTWVNCRSTDSIQVQLYADGVAVGEEVVITAADNWFHLWTNLPDYDTEGNVILYTVGEVPIDGYDSTVTEGTPPSDQIWTQAAGFQDGETYLIVSSYGAIANTSENVLSWMARTSDNENNMPLTSQWVASASGSYFTLTNKSSGRVIAYVNDGGTPVFRAYSSSDTGDTLISTSTCGIYSDTSGLRLYAKPSGPGYYFFNSQFHQAGGIPNAPLVTLYRLTGSTQVSDKHFDITNIGAYELPATGGNGILPYPLIGLTLFVGSFLTGTLWMHRQRRESSTYPE